MNILVAEDNKESRYLLEKMLHGYGHEVTTVANMAEVLEQILTVGCNSYIEKSINSELFLADIEKYLPH